MKVMCCAMCMLILSGKYKTGMVFLVFTWNHFTAKGWALWIEYVEVIIFMRCERSLVSHVQMRFSEVNVHLLCIFRLKVDASEQWKRKQIYTTIRLMDWCPSKTLTDWFLRQRKWHGNTNKTHFRHSSGT